MNDPTPRNADNQAPLWVVMIIAVGLGIAGIVFLAQAGDAYTSASARTPNMVGGIVCLALATVLLIFGTLLFRSGGRPSNRPSPNDG